IVRIETKTVIGILRRGFFVSSANAPEFSQPTKPEIAIGKARASPPRPGIPPRLVKGSPSWPPARKKITTESSSRPTASTRKKIKAHRDEIRTPRKRSGVVTSVATTETSIQFSEGTSALTHEPRNTTTAATVIG